MFFFVCIFTHNISMCLCLSFNTLLFHHLGIYPFSCLPLWYFQHISHKSYPLHYIFVNCHAGFSLQHIGRHAYSFIHPTYDLTYIWPYIITYYFEYTYHLSPYFFFFQVYSPLWWTICKRIMYMCKQFVNYLPFLFSHNCYMKPLRGSCTL